MVMTPSLVTITIPFQPILKEIAACLGFPEPLYSIKDLASNNCCVVIETSIRPNAYSFEGGPSSSLEGSARRAAEKAVLFLMDKYKVRVEDVNLERRERSRKCFKLFKLRRKEFQCIEKGGPKLMPCEADICTDGSDTAKYISVNFVEILGVIVKKFSINVTPIEFVQFGEEGFVAWITMQCRGSHYLDDNVIGGLSATALEAKQCLAKKAILFLMPRYNFEVRDANYHIVKHGVFAYKLQRGYYLAIKDRVYGFKEEREPCPCLLDQDALLTPGGEQFRIATSHDPPLPPKKRKVRSNFSDIVPPVVVLAELETISKRRKIE